MYMRERAKPLSFRAKTGAFCRGLVGKGPLLEVARAGLSANVPEGDAALYAAKVISKSTPEEISSMLAKGKVKSEKAQEIFAQSLLTQCTLSGANGNFAKFAEDSLSSGNVSSKEAQEMLASVLMVVVTSRLEGNPVVSGEAFNVWKSGKVTSAKAKEHLAWCIKNNGTVLQAVEVFKLGQHPVTAQMHLAAKISSEGDAINAYDAIISGSATFNEVQKMLASLIMREGTPAMARTALISNNVTDPEAVIFLKQTLRA